VIVSHAIPKWSEWSGYRVGLRFQEAARHSAKFEVIGQRRSRRYWPMARNSRGMP